MADPTIIEGEVLNRASERRDSSARARAHEGAQMHAGAGAQSQANAQGASVRKRSTWKRALIGVLALLYILSPLDLVPDWIPFVGWLDDIGILAWAARQVFFKK